MLKNKIKIQSPPKLSYSQRQYPSSKQQTLFEGESIVLDCQPLIVPNQVIKFDEETFKINYQRALELIKINSQSANKRALVILQYLCKLIPYYSSQNHQTYQVLENVVINCWKLKNSIKKQSEQYSSYAFISQYIKILQKICEEQRIKKQNLSFLYLIKGNEQYDQRRYVEAFESCEISSKLSHSPKNHAHLLKVHFLKSKIYESLHQSEGELIQIKKCLQYINNLSFNISQKNFKDYTTQLKNNLYERKKKLEALKVEEKDFIIPELHKSITKFRKRSVSMKKEKANPIQSQDQIQNNTDERAFKIPISFSIHLNKSKSQSKFVVNRNPPRKQFEVLKNNQNNLGQKQPHKLKKKPLKINYFEKNEEQINQEIMDGILEIQDEKYDPSQFHQKLLLSRPNTANNPNSIKILQKVINPLIKKISQQQKQIERVHDNQVQLTGDQIDITFNAEEKSPILVKRPQQNKINYDELLKNCVKSIETLIFNDFVKKVSDENTKLQRQNEPNHQEEIDYQTEVVIACNFEDGEDEQAKKAYESSSVHNFNIHFDQSFQIFTEFGFIRSISIEIKIQKKEHVKLDQADLYEKNLQIGIKIYLQQYGYLNADLIFAFSKIQEKSLQNILHQIYEQQQLQELTYSFLEKLESNIQQQSSQLKYKILNLIVKNIKVVKNQKGKMLIQKASNKSENKKAQLRKVQNEFVNYELNVLTTQQILKARMKLQYTDGLIREENKNCFKYCEVNFANNELLLMQNQNLSKIIVTMFENFNQEQCRRPSMRRFLTDKLKKETVFSFKSTSKSFSQIEMNNTRSYLQYELKSLSEAIVPSDFNEKVNRYFQPQNIDQDFLKETSVQQFYYCMKFLLMKPANDDQQQLFQSFYNQINTSCLHQFQLNSVLITMSYYSIKPIFNNQKDTFFKFQIQFKQKKVKMFKLIMTWRDVEMIFSHQKYKIHPKIKSEDKANRIQMSQQRLFELLQKLSQKLFIKKSFLYNSIGVESDNKIFNYINKFRLEGKTVQNKNFLSPHLKMINILCQRSIKIECERKILFGIITSIKIEFSFKFDILLYIPKFQRNYSINLEKNIFNYFDSKMDKYIFDNKNTLSKDEKLKILFEKVENEEEKQFQRLMWNRLISLITFETLSTEEKTNVIVNIGSFRAFLKDCSMNQYFQMKDKIFQIEISIEKKVNEAPSVGKMTNSKFVKRKSSSNKDIFEMRRTLVNNKQELSKSKGKRLAIFSNSNNSEVFQKMTKIFQSETKFYVIYLTLTYICSIQNNQLQKQEKTKLPQKLNISWVLSDIVETIKNHKKEVKQSPNNYHDNQFNEESFNYSVLLRGFTILKYKLISSLQNMEQIQHLFNGNQIIEQQKMLKSKLNVAFESSNLQRCSLNAFKRFNLMQKDVFLINKNILNLQKKTICTMFYNLEKKRLQFYLSSNNNLKTKQTFRLIQDIPMPSIQFFNKDTFLKANRRILKYYKNILLYH